MAAPSVLAWLMIIDSTMPHSVFWSLDTTHKAEAIRCNVCHLCEWRNPQQTIVCQYGGPFEGYQTPDGVALADFADDKE